MRFLLFAAFVLAALDRRCSEQAFSGCGRRRRLCGGSWASAAASLVAERGLQGSRLPAVAPCGFCSAGSAVIERELSCPMTCGIILGQGWNPHLLRWQADS